MPYFRDRILADNMFLFKVGAEVLIDSGEWAVVARAAAVCPAACGWHMPFIKWLANP